MNCCFETAIDCCETLTKTDDEFVFAMVETTGMTYGGLMKNKRCRKIIERRKKRRAA